MAGRQRARKNGRLSQQRHGDCFLHVPSSWLTYWPVSHASENLMVVKVTLDDKRHFLTSLCQRGLPARATGTGYRSPPRDVEIDTHFAKQLGIMSAHKTEVLVEAVDDIERCTHLCLEPLVPEDLDKLESNQGKIEFELLNRIRVVSGHSFCFPIWIDIDIIPVRVVSSEPAATWVLLGSELTGVRGEAATAITFKRHTDLSPPDSSSSDSFHSPPTPGVIITDTTPPWTHHGLSNFEGTSPEFDGETASITSSTGSKLYQFFRPIFSAINSQGTIQANVGSERSGTKTPEPAGASAPSTAASKTRPPPMHRKSKSCSQISDSGSPYHRLPKYVETLEMNALLRVQPHNIRGPSEVTPGGRGTKFPVPQWEHSRVFDVYVHPSTLPEVSNNYYSSGKLESFLVQLKPSRTHTSRPNSGQTQGNGTQSNKTENSERISAAPASDALPSLVETESVSSPVNETGFELSRIMSVVASSFQDSQSDASDASSGVKSDAPISLALPESLVVRLCFATKLVSDANGRVLPLPHSPLTGTKCKEVLTVAPGHVVMSELVRRQLKVGGCDVVRVCGVKEEGRMPVGSRHVTVHLRPLNEQSSIMKTHRESVEEAVKEWVAEVARENPFGPVLVEHQIIPVVVKPSGVTEYCSVEVPTSNRLTSSSGSGSKTTHSLDHYVMVSPQELTHSHRPGRVKFVVEKTRWSSGGVVSLPPLSYLDPPSLSLDPLQFGAFDELVERGRAYLESSLLHRDPHGRAGRFLISGSSGEAGLGCGKTSLARLIVQSFTSHPTYAHIQLIDCTTFRGQTAVRVGKRLKEIFETAIECQPSLVLLDDLHNAISHFSEGQDQTSGEAVLATRHAQALLDQLSVLDNTTARVAVVATARSRQDLHPMLLESRGVCVFEESIEIHPPDLVGREAILSAMMESRAVYMEGDLRPIAAQTEGYQVGDLAGLVDRAISFSHIRHTCPDALHARQSSSVAVKSTSRVSFTLDDLETVQGGRGSGGFNSPLITRSLPSSPLKERKRLKMTKSLSPTGVRLGSMENASISTATLTERVDSRQEDEGGRVRVAVRDFREALAGFVPLALQSLSLHSNGAVDFSSVGGMNETKRFLRETILWPSVYPKLFSQCPIRMCRGILLYGPPGTGKTLLAGAIAKQFGLNFVSIKGPEIFSKYIGASEQAVRDLFVRAQAAKPCVLFFDEFDSLAPKRGQDRTGVTDRVVNQLLTQMDGVESLEGVYIVAATSRPDMIDPALLRPGRIDKSILCDHPNEEERQDILKALTRTMRLDSNANLRHIAKNTEHYTGADLKGVLYSAQLRVAHRALDREKVECGGELSEGDSGAGVRVYRLSGVTHTGGSTADAELQKRAMMLRKILRDPLRDTLRSNTNHAGGGQRKPSVYITQEDLLVALDDVKPSVTPEERQRLTDIYDKFTGKVQQTLKAVINQRATLA